MIAPGDDIWTLGVRYAVQPSAIWDFPDNGAYKATYPNPYTLLPAQVLYIPPPQIKWVELDSGATHQLVIADPVRKMKVRLDVRGKPVPDGLAVTVRTDAGEQQLTTRQGAIELVVPPGATRAQLLTPGFGAETYEVRLGELPPIESAAGVVRRLVNIGYLGEPGADQTKNSEALAAAAQTFQRTFGLALAAPAADGTVDANTRAALVQAAGA